MRGCIRKSRHAGLVILKVQIFLYLVVGFALQCLKIPLKKKQIYSLHQIWCKTNLIFLFRDTVFNVESCTVIPVQWCGSGRTLADNSKARHATTLPRQRDHVFRPQNCWLMHYVYSRYSHSFRHRNLSIFHIFVGWKKLYNVVELSLCRVFSMLKNCLVPSSG